MFPADKNKILMEEAMELKIKNIPNKLYKYGKIDKDGYFIKNLREGTVWMNRADKLNDPFECFFSLDLAKIYNWNPNKLKDNPRLTNLIINGNEDLLTTVGINLENIGEMNYETVFKKVMENDLDFGNDKDKIDKLWQIRKNEMDEIILQNHNAMLERTKRNSYISCFSECNKSRLMWAHYADNYSGFCIEYDFTDEEVRIEIKRMLVPVIYRNSPIDLTDYFLKSDNFNNLISIYFSMIKHTDWNYEKEWRLVVPGGEEFGTFNQDSGRIKSIYLGNKMKDEEKALLVSIAKIRSIEVYELKLNEFNYEIGFEKL